MTWFPFLLLGEVLKGSGCPSLGPQPSEKQGTRAYLRIPPLDPASASAKAAWKMELDQSSSVSTGLVQLMVTPPADAPVGAYRLTAEHRGESAPLGRMVLLFNPWCPGRSLIHSHAAGPLGMEGGCGQLWCGRRPPGDVSTITPNTLRIRIQIQQHVCSNPPSHGQKHGDTSVVHHRCAGTVNKDQLVLVKVQSPAWGQGHSSRPRN